MFNHRFHLRSLMIAVGVFALLLIDLQVRYSWWSVRPLIYFALVPLVAATVLYRRPPRFLMICGAILSFVLLLAWYELRRPLERSLIGHEDTDHLIQIFLYRGNSTIIDTASFLADWVLDRGTLADVVCVLGSLLLMWAMLAGPISLRSRWIAAIVLVVIAGYDWATSKTWGGTTNWPPNIERRSGPLLAQWPRGEITFAWLTRIVGLIGFLELFVLVATLFVLISVAVYALLRRTPDLPAM